MPRLQQFLAIFARPGALGAAVLAGALLASPSVLGGFATDDHNFRLVFLGAPGLPEFARAPWEVFSFYADRGPALREAFIERGLLPWWTGDTFRAAFCRPLSSLSHYVDFLLFGEQAWAMHLHSIMLFAALGTAAGLLYRRLLGPGLAGGIAAAVFALDEARGLNVGWLSGRNALLTALFSVLVLLAHDRWRREGWRPGILVAPALWALGLASGEAALAAGGYLLAYALTLDRAPWRARAASLLVYTPVFLCWALLYRHFEFGTHASTGYVDPADQPLLFLQNAVIHGPVQLFGIFGWPDTVFFNVLSGPFKLAYWLHAVAYMAVVLWLLRSVLREYASARFALVGMLLALLPAAATLPQDRLLTMGAVGGAMLLGLLIHRLASRADRTRLEGFALALLAGLHLVLAPLLLPITSTATWAIEKGNRLANESLPYGADIADDDVVIIANGPTELMSIGVPVTRSSLGQPVPRHTLLLTAGTGEVTIRRIDERTILLTADDFINTPWANLFRSTTEEPFRPGWHRDLARVDIEVLSTWPSGAPREARFTFDAPLESPSLHWTTWGGNRYEPFVLPALGEALRLPARPFLPIYQPEFTPVQAR